MTGLILKDFFVARKNIQYYFGFLVIYGLLSMAGVFPYSVMAGMVALTGMMLPMASFSYDDIAKWEKFAVASPAGRRGVVQGKYSFALLGTFAAAVLVAVLLTAAALLGKIDVEFWWEPLVVVGVCSCMTLLLDSIMLPFLLKYGAEKARIISLLIFASVFGGMALLAYLVEGGFTFPTIPAQVLVLLPALLVVVTVAGLAVSYAVSLGIYGKKEM